MTSDADWNPSLYDNDVDDMEQFYDASADVIHHDNFDQYGEYRHRTVANHATIPDEEFFDALSYHDLEDMIDDIVDNNKITNLMGDPYSSNDNHHRETRLSNVTSFVWMVSCGDHQNNIQRDDSICSWTGL
jgi:hypothetical protein